MNRRLAAVALLALAACAPRTETDSARTAIEAANARWARHMATGQADSAALNFAEDAVLMMDNGPSIRGRTAIQAKFAELLSYGTWQVALATTRVEAYGPVAIEQGTKVVRFTPGPRAPAGMAALYPDTGKYLTYWKKVDGAWLEAVEIGSSSRAALAPARVPVRH